MGVSAAAEALWTWINFSCMSLDWRACSDLDGPEEAAELMTRILAVVQTCFGEDFPISKGVRIAVERGIVSDFDKNNIRYDYPAPVFVLYVNSTMHNKGVIIRNMSHMNDVLSINTDEYTMVFNFKGLPEAFGELMDHLDPYKLLDDPCVMPRDEYGNVSIRPLGGLYDSEPAP